VARLPTKTGLRASPIRTPNIERFNRTYRDEVLNAYLFDSISEVREIADAWLERYNEIRPHDALGSLPPEPHSPRVASLEMSTEWGS
jgi:putative transposase